MSKITINDYFIETKVVEKEVMEFDLTIFEVQKLIPIHNITDIDMKFEYGIDYEFRIVISYYNRDREYSGTVLYKTKKEMIEDWKKLSTLTRNK